MNRLQRTMDAVGQRSRPRSAEQQVRLRSMLDDNVDFVARTLRKAGVPASELDDEVQRTFIIASRRLDDVQQAAERKFLYQVALHVAAHMRRKLARRREVSEDQAPERVDAFASPQDFAERRRMREQVDGILERMHESLRAVLILYAFEDLSTPEIAALLGIPRGTVASRLRRARKAFREDAAAIDVAPLGNGPTAENEHVSWRQENWSALARALFSAGASPPALARTHARIFAALGLLGVARPRRGDSLRSSQPAQK